MFYEEAWIHGKLYWRGIPKGEWIEADSAKLNLRLQEEQKRARDAFEQGRLYGYGQATNDFGVTCE